MQSNCNWFFITIVVSLILTTGCHNKQQLQNQQFNQIEEEHNMQPTIRNRELFTVMGISNHISSSEQSSENYAKIWSQFERYNEQLKKISTNRKYYGVTFTAEKQNMVDYIVGMAVPEKATPIDKEMTVRQIPAAQYAIFECPIQNIGRTYQYIIRKWLPNSPYKINSQAASFEEYPPEGQENLPVCIHIPVIEKSG
jgi:predicted transcriptional regulator YdeE